MCMPFVGHISTRWNPRKPWPASALFCDMPGSVERQYVEHLYSTLADADLSKSYPDKLNAVKHLIVEAFRNNSIPEEYPITLPLFCGNHTTMAQQIRYNKLKAEDETLKDEDMLVTDYMR